jgi:hypothetical protein
MIREGRGFLDPQKLRRVVGLRVILGLMLANSLQNLPL